MKSGPLCIKTTIYSKVTSEATVLQIFLFKKTSRILIKKYKHSTKLSIASTKNLQNKIARIVKLTKTHSSKIRFDNP